MSKRNLILLMIFLLSVTFTRATAYADKPKVKGYYIDKNGTKQEVLIQMSTGLMSDDLSVGTYQDGFVYFDKKGKKASIGVDDADEFGFIYKGEKYVFQFVPAGVEYKFMGITFKGEFYRLLLDGSCKLYSVIVSANTNIGTSIYYEYMLWKSRTEFYVSGRAEGKLNHGGRNHKNLEEFFSDCPALVEKIKNKEFKKGDDKYERMAKFYKECKDETPPEQEE